MSDFPSIWLKSKPVVDRPRPTQCNATPATTPQYKTRRKKIKNKPPLKHKNVWFISVTHNCTYTYVWNSVSSWQSCNPWLIKINNKNLTLPYKYKRIALKMGVRGLMSLCKSQRENHAH